MDREQWYGRIKFVADADLEYPNHHDNTGVKPDIRDIRKTGDASDECLGASDNGTCWGMKRY